VNYCDIGRAPIKVDRPVPWLMPKAAAKGALNLTSSAGRPIPPIKIAAAIHYAIAPSLGVLGGLDAAEGGF